jgi:2-aminobenzoate-CoA ligase
MRPTSSPAAIIVERRVEWSDTDAAGHHHFTSVLRWAEEAEFVLQERLGIAELVSGRCPRVHVAVDFKERAYPREVVEVELSVLEVGRTSVRYALTVRRDEETIAEGVVVAVFARDGRPTPWPGEVRRLLLESGRVEDERYASVASDRTAS